MSRRSSASLTSVLSALAIVASVSVAAPASATEQVLLVQSAPKSTVKLLENNTVSIFMRSQAQPFAAVAERPRRLVFEVPKRDAVALWDKSFGEIAPNAVLTGTTRAGKAQKYVFTLNSARSTAKGVRYTAELLSGNLKSSELVRLSNTDMLIDGIALTQGNFPSTVAVASAPDLTITAGQSFDFTAGEVSVFNSITVKIGASFTIPVASTFQLSAQSIDGVTSPSCSSVPGLSGVSGIGTVSGGCMFSWSSVGSPIIITNTSQAPIVMTTVTAS